MKAWDEKLEKFVEPVDDTKSKFVNAYFPWNEELAKATKVDVPHYEPVKEKQAKAAVFEYSIEIACAQDELNTYQVGVFSLGKTKEEGNISTWNKTQNEKGFTLFTASVDVDEPKVLSREFFISSGSAMVFDDVKPVKQGVAHATESFVPIKPSIQVYERLSWPKVGFFYHFIDDELINEYQLAGGDKWSFKVTQSKGKVLSNELLSEHEYGFILLPWKINNTVVARQHLLYTKEKITQEQLSEINAAWLDDNARCLNPDEIVNARSEKALEREKKENGRVTYIVQSGDELGLIARKQGVEYDSLLTLNPQIINPDLIQVGDEILIKEENQNHDEVTSHICKINPKTGQCETWENIAVQHGMTAKELFDLNSNNPEHKNGALALGDELLLNQQQTVGVDESYRNAQSPADLTEDKLTFPFCNVWSVIEKNHTELAYVPVQEEKAIKNNTAIVNVKSVLLQSKLLAQSEILESIAQGKKEVIKKGAKGDEVKLIQEALLKMKFDLGSAGADGDFGSGTESAIKTFQSTYTPTNEVHPDYKVGSADGVVGKNTLLALDETVVGIWVYETQCELQIDHHFIQKLEGVETKGYVPFPDKSQSGVTIGTGFDLGARTLSDLKKMGLSKSLIDKFTPYLSLKKYDAVNKLEEIPLTITNEELNTLSLLVKQSETDKLVTLYNKSSSKVKFECLPSQAQTVIASVAYQYGNLSTETPKFWKQAIQQNWTGMHKNLLNFYDDYSTRRKTEATLLKGLL
ncbi:pesticin C-terminus-like muramidase [Aliivibrio logei]|uniref:LysM domain-containing protein n=1 Tax=Aliivibrio logei TaxID=688 RepID=A0A1B9P0T6_ALILO|nr:pesticin C-terminus-like muramidase [Aliivibrio logei]OCH21921.1 hypothetical protein A6E04_08665 [Aliivibrio logei]